MEYITPDFGIFEVEFLNNTIPSPDVSGNGNQTQVTPRG